MNVVCFAKSLASSDECSNKCFEILVPESKGEIRCRGSQTAFTRGDVLVVPPLMKYSTRGECLHVLIEKALLPFKELRVFKDDAFGSVAGAAKQAEFYFKNGGGYSVLAALGELLVAYVIHLAGKEHCSPVVASVREEVEKNLSDSTFSIEDYLKKLPLNYDYIRKLFKKEIGLTPHEYLTERRMKLARELMESGITNQYSNYSVSQIAEACGFAEPLYFSRVFKKRFGMAPSEALQKNKDGSARPLL